MFVPGQSFTPRGGSLGGNGAGMMMMYPGMPYQPGYPQQGYYNGGQGGQGGGQRDRKHPKPRRSGKEAGDGSGGGGGSSPGRGSKERRDGEQVAQEVIGAVADAAVTKSTESAPSLEFDFPPLPGSDGKAPPAAQLPSAAAPTAASGAGTGEAGLSAAMTLSWGVPAVWRTGSCWCDNCGPGNRVS